MVLGCWFSNVKLARTDIISQWSRWNFIFIFALRLPCIWWWRIHYRGYNVISVGKDSDFLQIFSIQTSTLSFEQTQNVSQKWNVKIFLFINPIQISETTNSPRMVKWCGLVIFSSTQFNISWANWRVEHDWPNQCHFNENEELLFLQLNEEIGTEGIFTSLGQSDALLMKFIKLKFTAHVFLSGSGSVSIADIESISSGSTLLTGHFSKLTIMMS